jgi:hypothetical protein
MSRFGQGITPFGVAVRVVVGSLAAMLILPFVMLAVVPMLLVLAPVAFVALPFMVSAFASETREVTVAPRRVLMPATQHAHAH